MDLIKIRKMNKLDYEEVINMMDVFYNSNCVHTNGSLEIFENDFLNCINDSPYLEGYIFIIDDKVCGYGMLAKSFSTEFGKNCIWIEDIYIKDIYRGNGIGKIFFKYVEDNYPNHIIRLEVSEDNPKAINFYQNCGFDFLTYMEMKKLN